MFSKICISKEKTRFPGFKPAEDNYVGNQYKNELNFSRTVTVFISVLLTKLLKF